MSDFEDRLLAEIGRVHVALDALLVAVRELKNNGMSATVIAELVQTNNIETDIQTPALLFFPTVGVQGHSWALTQTQVDEWATLYPGLDVVGECRAALAWVKASPERRKTPRGMPKFLVGWLTRSTNRGTPRRGPDDRHSGPGSGSALLDQAGYYPDKR